MRAFLLSVNSRTYAVGILPSAEHSFFCFCFSFLRWRAQKTKNTKMGSSRAITAGYEPDSSSDRVSRVNNKRYFMVGFREVLPPQTPGQVRSVKGGNVV
jgi:hypothetical protein